MQNNKKVALFDFCETLVNFQTADAFVDFVREKTFNKRMLRLEKIQQLLCMCKVLQIIDMITYYKLSVNKRIKLYQLKGFKECELDRFAVEYYNVKIKNHFIVKVLEKLKEFQDQGYAVGIVSGGYGIYERLFVKEFSLDFLLCSNLDIGDDKICTGKMKGKDCLQNNKLIYLNEYFKNKPSYSVAFTDSKSDLPFLRWANKGIVVSRHISQKWALINNFEEIIW